MVLVTGATGLVGAHLVLHLLENQQQVRAIFRSEKSIEKTRKLFHLYHKDFLFDKIEWVPADITDVPSLTPAFQAIDYVYHCAAFISFDSNDEKLVRKTNIEGTANIVNLSLDFKIKKLLFVSSIAALGDLKAHETVVTEETDWNPELQHSDYAISKHGAEMEVWRGQQEGLQVAIINPGVILGPGFWNSGSGEIFTRVAKGLLFYTKGTTGFVSVDDVVKMMFQVMERKGSGEQYVAVAENISFEKILSSIAIALQVKKPAFYSAPWVTSIGWVADWILSDVFNRRRKLSKRMARSLHEHHYFSNQKAKEVLDFKFHDIGDTIKKTVSFYPENKS